MLVGGVVAHRGGDAQAAVVRRVVVDDLDVEHVHAAGGVDDDVRDDLAPDLALRVVVVAHGGRGAQPRFHGQVGREEVARFDLVAKGAVGQRR